MKKTKNYTYNYSPELYEYILKSNLLNHHKDEHKILKELVICPKGNFVVTMQGHITAIINNVIVDTFDCSKRIMKCCWQIK